MTSNDDDDDDGSSSPCPTAASPAVNRSATVCGRGRRGRRFATILSPVASPVDRWCAHTYAHRRVYTWQRRQTRRCIGHRHYTRLRSKVDRLNDDDISPAASECSAEISCIPRRYIRYCRQRVQCVQFRPCRLPSFIVFA